MTTALAILLPNWIGDAVMATPTLRALRHGAGRGARLVGFGRRAICELLAGGAQLDKLRELPAAGRFPLERSLRLAARLRAGRFDCAILLTNGLGVAWAAWLAGIGRRVGYTRRGRGPLLTQPLDPPRDARGFQPISAIDYYLALASALGCPAETTEMELATTAADEAAADRIWAGFDLCNGRPTILLNNNTAAGTAKLWPAASMAALARRVVQALDFNVLVLAGPGEQAAASRIVELAAISGVIAMSAPGIGAAKACIRRARLMVSTDSGPRHIAAAFGVPLVSLFGDTDPRWTDLHTPLDLALKASSMRELSVDRVWSAVQRQLERLRA